MRLSEDSKLIVFVADQLRRLDGRPKWSTQNLPGKDTAAALTLLRAIDGHLNKQHEHKFVIVDEVRYGNMPEVRVCVCGEWGAP